MQNTLSPLDKLKACQQTLLQNPKDFETQLNCGNLCLELQRFEEAAGYFRRLLRVFKNHAYMHNALCFSLESLGNLAQNAGNFVQAEACFEEALEYKPNNAAYWYNLGNAQRELGKPKVALESFMQALKFDANDADTHNNLGNVQRELGQLDKAILSYQKALQINPSLHHALAHLVHQKQHICDWRGLDAQISQLRKWVETEPTVRISPFAFLAMPGTTAQEQKQCATNYASSVFKALPATLIDVELQVEKSKKKKPKEEIRIGYFSADFRLHPLAFLITELIEKHDRKQFKIFAYSYGKNDKTPVRKRLEKAFDHFIDIANLSDIEAAKKIRGDEIDILVDLTGYTQSSRTEIVALKPAKTHINWLGFPGTMGEINGEPLFDYLLADKTIAPDAKDFSEKLLYLPCYQPNDNQRPIKREPVTRMNVGLQTNDFVFCCFNQTFKITAKVFAVWISLLKQTPNSVLWLLECNVWAKANLQEAASHAGIDQDRLIFAPRVPVEEHLSRHVHADLFLDTLPYNAHTTASDALFMRLPLLTCTGETFASRVASGLLHSVNMPELITRNLEEYEQKALEFARNPEKLARLKQKLNTEIEKSNLFNPTQFARDLEDIFLDVYNKHNPM